jgi:SAM-dependent methyltransferase
MTTIVGEELCEAVDVVPGERVFDVACGSGNGALAAARRTQAETVGVDFVPELLEHGRRRAAAERLAVEFVEGDAEDLPFEDGSFDVVVSIFGAMFAPDQERAASEILRVCRPGGRIGLASGPRKGSSARPRGRSPSTRRRRRERGRRTSGARRSGCASCSARQSPSSSSGRGTSASAFARPSTGSSFFRDNFGPVKTAFERLDERGSDALAADAKAARYSRAASHPGDAARRATPRAAEPPPAGTRSGTPWDLAAGRCSRGWRTRGTPGRARPRARGRRPGFRTSRPPARMSA